MNASIKPMTTAKIVNVKIERAESGVFIATSSELKGLLVAKQTLDSVNAALPQAIIDMYAVCGVDVIVSRAEDGSDYNQPWVAVPAETAKRQLANA